MPARDPCARTFDFACGIVRLCRQLSANPGISRQIAGQLLRAGTSIGANAEEAKAAYTRREFACKYALVLREARETHCWLRLIAVSRLARGDALETLPAEANELVAILTVAARKARTPLTPDPRAE
jgi:four helix bundle protein